MSSVAEARIHQEALERIKSCLVHLDYDSAFVLSAARGQICRLSISTSKRQAYRTAITDFPFMNWLSIHCPIHKGPFKNIIWMSSASCDDLTISYISLYALDALQQMSTEEHHGLETGKPTHCIVHSIPQTELQVLAVAETKRSLASLLKEAIYQLLCQNTSVVSTNDFLKRFVRKAFSVPSVNIQELGTILLDLLNHNTPILTKASTSHATDNQRTSIMNPRPFNPTTALSREPIFWIIDRIDECTFRGGSGVTNLYDFIKLLDWLVARSNGRLRVLITSLYPPERLDRTWEYRLLDEEDEERQGLKSLIECKHANRRLPVMT
jgi:hypothetical protein